MNKLYPTLLLLFVSLQVFAQTFIVKGTVIDGKDNSRLPGATVVLISADGDKTGGITNQSGNFELEQLPGRYTIQVSFLGYETLQKTITINNAPLELGNLALNLGTKELNEVQVVGKIPTGEQKGDTAQFNAAAFKTNPDATAEDLVQKVPGVTVQDGKVKAQGEDVKRVLVDGKEFFGDDAAATLRNMPAEAIDKIQIFDQQSDQSRLTGFNDGQTTKAINIVTRPNMRNGKFGKVYAGAGTDDHYQAGGSINIFKGDRRITLLGQTNNINQQNFSGEDLVGVSGGGGRRGGGSRSGGGGYRGGGGDEFQVSQLGGITRTYAGGLNYSDKWGKKMEISGSYFFNNGVNNGFQEVFRQFIADEATSRNPNQEDIIDNQFEREFSNSNNTNHRFNLRLEYNIDSANSIFFRQRFSMQINNGTSDLDANTRSATDFLNETRNIFESELTGISASNELTFRHQFAKRGRSFAIGLNSSQSGNTGESYLDAVTTYYDPLKFEIRDQFSRMKRVGWSFTPNIMYTEPIGKKSQLQINYSRTFQENDSDKRTYNLTEGTTNYNNLDTLQSNIFLNESPSQQVGLGYRFFNEKFSMYGRVSYQNSELENERTFPTETTFQRSFNNIVPFGYLMYNFSRQKNLRVFYRGNTNTPSVEQLQDVLDISNPIQPRIGNPDLQQSYSHDVSLRYSASNVEKSSSFYAYLGANTMQNSVVNQIITNRQDILFYGVEQYEPGIQLIRPVNMDGQYSLSSYMSYGIPIKYIKSNMNLSFNADQIQRPGLIRGEKNLSLSRIIGGTITLSSNISTKLDFTLSSSSNYNNTQNTIGHPNSYFNQTNRARLNWIFWKDIVFNTEFSNRVFTGLNAGIDQNYNLWNISLGKKLFEKKNGDIRLSVVDALKQNNSIQRNINANYIEDVQSLVLQRYYMLTFTYNIRRFGNGANAVTPGTGSDGGSREPGQRGPRGGGFRPGGN